MLTDEQLQALCDILKQSHYKEVDRYQNEMVIFRGKKLRIRILNHEQAGFAIHIASDAHFDRWANSVDFTINIYPTRFPAALWQARKFIKERVRDFNEPGRPINLNRFAVKE